MDATTIAVDVEGDRGSIALNRPDQLNPLSTTTLLELAAAADWFRREHPEVKVVVVSGRGRAFTAGADLAAFGGSAGGGPRSGAEAGSLMADAVEAIPAVTVARIQGHCVGGGVVLAAACDLRVAAEGTRFAIPEVALGIPLAWGGIPRLLREVGPAVTKELVMTCRPFDADEARSLGLVNRVVPEADLDSAVDELVGSLLAMPTLALRATKRHVDAVAEQMVGTARTWSDPDVLTTALHDPESKAVRERYLRDRGR